MTAPIQTVEVGFDTSFSGAGDFFTLDDATKGELDNSTYLLAGLSFIDVTPRVRNFRINRGRSNLFTNFPAGQVSIEFNNHDRAFDPLYLQSPYAGNIVPRREVRISTNNEVQFSGWIDDWSFTYAPNGDSIAEALAYDATSILSNQVLAAGTPTAQKPGARINAILDEINWLSSNRSIDTGVADLGDQPIAENTNAVTYLQQVAYSEQGLLFINKLGQVRFVEKGTTTDLDDAIQFGGTGISFQNLKVSYGSENLYNRIIVARELGGTATVTDTQSVADYGLRVLTASNVLLSDNSALVDFGLDLVQKYALPQYRFDSLEIALHKLDANEQNQVLGLELGSVVKISFRPNDIGATIERLATVISMQHTVRVDTHYVEFGLDTLPGGFWTLSDPIFGKLSAGNYIGF